MSQASPPSTTVLRAASVVVLLLAMTATGLQAIGALRAMNRADLIDPVPTLFAPSVMTLMAGVALIAVIEGIAQLVARPTTEADQHSHDATAPAIERLTETVAELRAALPELLADLRQTPTASVTASPFYTEPEAVHETSVVQPTAMPTTVPVESTVPQLDRVVQLLEEMKELSLLDESQRQARGQMSKERKKLERVDEAAALIARNEWERADALLTLLESLHPGDTDVLARRNELDDLRTAAREGEWAQRYRQAEDLLALSRYDEAAAVVAGFRELYPTHVDAAGLSAQIVSDREAYIERGAASLFNEIKSAVDARQWRMALDGTQRFLSRYPDNIRSDRIRQQVRTIQKNAEIEERHENEDRIKDLARSGRFAEAADLCETLLSRFPTSPQAPSLQNLLPRLRERSAMAEAAVE